MPVGRAANLPVALSVGIPTYNQGEYIGRTLESLLSQTVPPHEIVVSENHCTDDTPRVLEKFADRVRVVRPPSHLSMTESWDYTLGQLEGSWFSLLSSDDIALPRFVETLTRLADEVPDAVLVRGGYQVIDGAGRVVKVKQFRDDRAVLRYPDTLRQQLRGPHTSFTAFAARTDVARRVGGFGKDDGFLGDWSMWIRLAPHGAFVYTPESFSQYRAGHRSHRAEQLRFMSFLAPETRVYRELIRGVIEAHGGVSEGDVRAAARERCRGYLASGSVLFPAAERASVVSAIQDWCVECGLAEELAVFASGGSVMRTPRSRPAMVIRSLGRRLRSLTGRRRRDYRPPHA